MYSREEDPGRDNIDPTQADSESVEQGAEAELNQELPSANLSSTKPELVELVNILTGFDSHSWRKVESPELGKTSYVYEHVDSYIVVENYPESDNDQYSIRRVYGDPQETELESGLRAKLCYTALENMERGRALVADLDVNNLWVKEYPLDDRQITEFALKDSQGVLVLQRIQHVAPSPFDTTDSTLTRKARNDDESRWLLEAEREIEQLTAHFNADATYRVFSRESDPAAIGHLSGPPAKELFDTVMRVNTAFENTRDLVLVVPFRDWKVQISREEQDLVITSFTGNLNLDGVKLELNLNRRQPSGSNPTQYTASISGPEYGEFEFEGQKALEIYKSFQNKLVNHATVNARVVFQQNKNGKWNRKEEIGGNGEKKVIYEPAGNKKPSIKLISSKFGATEKYWFELKDMSPKMQVFTHQLYLTKEARRMFEEIDRKHNGPPPLDGPLYA